MIRRRLTGEAWRLRAAAAINLLLIAVIGLFAFGQVHRVAADHVFTSTPFALEYLLLAGLFVIRRRPRQTIGRGSDWLIAATAWLVLLAQPTDTWTRQAIVGDTIGIVGAILTLACVASLGRSFGIVAANRGVKTSGAYRLLRHPVYAAESIALAGFLISNPGLFNALLIGTAMACLPLRIGAEERVLRADDAYRRYSETVRWRMVPGLY